MRLRTKTGLPRHLTIMALPGFRSLRSISRLASASTSAEGFICARNFTATRRPSDAPMKRAPPAQTHRGKGWGSENGGAPRMAPAASGRAAEAKMPGLRLVAAPPSASEPAATSCAPHPAPAHGDSCVRQRLTEYGVVVGPVAVVVVTHADLVLCHRLARHKLIHINGGSWCRRHGRREHP